MRAANHRHRSVGIAVVDGAGRLVVHQRADWKDVWPSRWDVGFGGVVGVGESWEEAAHRELLEEAGVDADLTDLGEGTYEDGDVRMVGRLYLARHDGPFHFADREVVAEDRVPLDGLRAWIDDGRETCPDSVATLVPRVLAWWADQGRGLVSTATWAWLAAFAVLAVADWVAVVREDTRVRWVTKPGALIALIGAALALTPADGTVRAWMVVGLVLSLGGDVFLLLRNEKVGFPLGLGSFLLGHVAYVVGDGAGVRVGGAARRRARAGPGGAGVPRAADRDGGAAG